MSHNKSKSKKQESKGNEPLVVYKPSVIVFDIIGTVVKTNFIDEVLFGYIQANMAVYLNNNWNQTVTQADVEALRAQSKRDADGPVILSSGSDKAVQQSVCDYISTCLAKLRTNQALAQFRFHMIFDGYRRNKLKTAVYTDVAVQLSNWTNEGIVLYVMSNTWKELTQRLMSQTNHGNLDELVSGYFDNTEGSFISTETYCNVSSAVKGAKLPGDILFLTKLGGEARAAISAGLEALLVLTHQGDLDRRTKQDLALPFVRTFDEIKFKPDGPRPSQLAAANGFVGGTPKTSISKVTTSYKTFKDSNKKSSSKVASSTTKSKSSKSKSSKSKSSKSNKSNHSNSSNTTNFFTVATTAAPTSSSKPK